MKDISDTHAISCTGSIDNFSIVLGGYGPEQENLYEARLIKMSEAGLLKQTKASRNGFARNYKFKEAVFESRVLISTKSIRPNGPALRLEFNPAKLGSEDTATVLNDIAAQVLVEGVQELYERARVTRFDVAFDLFDFDLSQAHFWCDKTSSSQTYNGIGMRTETLVFNQTGRRQVVVYDKARERKSKGQIPYAEPWTRVEVRKRNAGQLISLKKAKNPMLDFHLSARSKPVGISETAWVLINAATGPTTLQAVLGQLPMSKRAKIKNALKKQTLVGWNAEKIWKSWPQIVGESGLLLPLHQL